MPDTTVLASALTATCRSGAMFRSACPNLQQCAAGFIADGGCRCVTGDDDNDGLWTCVYAAGLAFKYAVTRQEEDRQRAWHRCVAGAIFGRHTPKSSTELRVKV